MKKAFGYLFLIFAAIVSINYFSFLLGSLFNAHPISSVSASSNELGSVNFSLFDKNGRGWSYVTQGYGHTPYSYLYPGDLHDGIDIAAAYGAPIYSPSDTGTVIATGNQDDYCYKKAFGKYVAAKDPTNNLILWYAHLGTIDVSVGQTVSKGALIGTVGTTGLETGTHLHFSIFDANGFTMESRDGCGPEPTGKDLNPLNYLGGTYQ